MEEAEWWKQTEAGVRECGSRRKMKGKKMLCNHVGKHTVLTKHSEPAFRKLEDLLLLGGLDCHEGQS